MADSGAKRASVEFFQYLINSSERLDIIYITCFYKYIYVLLVKVHFYCCCSVVWMIKSALWQSSVKTISVTSRKLYI